MTDVVAIGESLGLYRGQNIGPLTPGDPTTFSFAGAESNVAIALARLGHAVAMAGRVGADPIGQVIMRHLRSEGIDLAGMTVDPEAPTAFMMRQHRTADRVTATYYRHGSAGSRLSRADVDETVVRSARVLHTTGITLALSPSSYDATQYAMKIARDAGVTVSLDINHRSRLIGSDEAGAMLRALIDQVDVVFGSEHELQMIVAEQDPEALVEAVAALGPSEVVLKRGEHGALGRADDRTAAVPVVPVRAVDPVGAGDAFVAGYLSSRLEGGTLDDRLRRGAVCGSFAVSVPGDWEGLPRRDELELLSGTENVDR
ncbi:MAG: sugar kinase [Nocardioidaceae bacterium]|nr:sugar kinase [Nocardioidaceae bacterium]MCL2613681.1 sugar kinase [Nocardioidaceae bacterium]